MNWTDEQIQAVWGKGTTVDRDTQFQWEIHHVKKTSDDDSNDIDNLVPFQGNSR